MLSTRIQKKSAHEFLDGNSRDDHDDQYDPDHKANVAGAPARHLEMEMVRHVMDWMRQTPIHGFIEEYG